MQGFASSGGVSFVPQWPVCHSFWSFCLLWFAAVAVAVCSCSAGSHGVPRGLWWGWVLGLPPNK
eukprot:142976-Amphidinium_carterae.1